MNDQIVLTFSDRSKGKAMVSSHEDKIVLIDTKSSIQSPTPGIPYLCNFSVYDTDPSNPLKGARIVEVIRPMIIDSIKMHRENGTNNIRVTLISGDITSDCFLSDATWDRGSEIKKVIKHMGCHVDYGKIKNILDNVERKLKV